MAENTATTHTSSSFKRSYVACSGCRARKVRCVIGAQPPCARCVRELRECIFEAHEKSHKRRNPPKWAATWKQNAGSTQSSTLAQRRQDETPAHRDSGKAHAMGPPDRLTTALPPIDHVSPATVTSLSDRMVSTVMTNSTEALDLLFNTSQPEQGRHGQVNANPEPRISHSSTGVGFVIVSLSEPVDEVLDMWDKFRFVRQGWITAQEAVTYIDLFYRHIAPLSSVKLDQFREHASHVRLVDEEPMLCSTMLMISSRLFMLPGSGGVSRSHNNHRRIWNYCEHLLQRVILGQEKQSTARIRVLGTVESLLLISDWPPRAIHLPPETEGWDSELMSPGYDRHNRRQHNDDAPLIRWREDVFEPAKRSERMSWMLLGVAVNLAHELGVFTELLPAEGAVDPGHEARKWRLRKLIYVYVTQASLRMRVPSTLPEHIAYTMASAQIPQSQHSADQSWHEFMDSWIELTKLSLTASAMFFQSPTHTKTQLLNGNYAPLLDHLLSAFKKWHESLVSPVSGMSCTPRRLLVVADGDDAIEISESQRSTLLIEYHHLKACTATIATQAVVEKAATFASNTDSQRPESLASYTSTQDAKFLRDVVFDSREVLRIASSTPFKQYMPYVPTRLRTYAVSSSVFLLKAICVGSSNTDVSASLKTIEESSLVLQQLAPDDMCFASRSAALIVKHTAQLRASLFSGREKSNGMSTAAPLSAKPSEIYTERTSGSFAGTPAVHDSVLPQDCMDDLTDFGRFDPATATASMEPIEWLTLPYDQGMAPFNSTSEQVSFGFELESLDFLWNLGGSD